MSKLRLSRGSKISSVFRVGLLCGISIALLVVLLFISRIVPDINQNSYFFAPFPMFRSIFLITLHITLWGVNLFVFSKTRVNHVFIFQSDPRTALSPIQMVEVGAWLTALLLSSLNLYLFSWARSEEGTDPEWEWTPYVHLFTFACLVVILFFPLNLFLRKSRKFLLTMVVQVLMPGFASVDFKSFWFADQLTSLVRALIDLSFALCFYVSGDFIDNNQGCVDDMRVPQTVSPLVACTCDVFLLLIECVY